MDVTNPRGKGLAPCLSKMDCPAGSNPRLGLGRAFLRFAPEGKAHRGGLVPQAGPPAFAGAGSGFGLAALPSPLRSCPQQRVNPIGVGVVREVESGGAMSSVASVRNPKAPIPRRPPRFSGESFPSALAEWRVRSEGDARRHEAKRKNPQFLVSWRLGGESSRRIPLSPPYPFAPPTAVLTRSATSTPVLALSAFFTSF